LAGTRRKRYPENEMGPLYKEGTIGAILYQMQLVDEKDIEAALEEQRKTGLRFGEALVNLGIVRQEDIDWALCHQLDISYVRIRAENVDPAAIELVPATVARRFMLLPLIRTGDVLSIAIADPLNKDAVDEVERVSGCSVSISLGLLREIREMQDHFYGSAGDAGGMGFYSTLFPPAAVAEMNADTTGAAMLDHLLAYLHDNRLSSLSLRPVKDAVAVIGKRSGASAGVGTFSPVHYRDLLLTVWRRSGCPKTHGLFAQCVVSMVRAGSPCSFQVAMTRAGEWEYVTFRPDISSPFPVSIALLETAGEHRHALAGLSGEPGGMVFFASPDSDARARLMGACLRESSGLGRDALALGEGFGFMSGELTVLPAGEGRAGLGGLIAASCLHEPDVIAVDELLDREAIASACRCALGGRLLFAGFPAPGLRFMFTHLLQLGRLFPVLPACMRGAASVRGVRVLCMACREKTAPPGHGPFPPGLDAAREFFRPGGCPVCGGTGYKGVRYLVEAVVFGGDTLEVFARAGSGGDVMEHLARKGFRGIADEMADMLREGIVTFEDYCSATLDGGEMLWRK